MPYIEFKNITKQYKMGEVKINALNNTNFEINIGVGFYAGLTASSPDMLDSLGSYTDNNKMYDINVISTLGLTDDDVNAIKQIDGIDEVYGLQTKDVLSTINDKEDVCKIIEYNPNINCPTIVA